jgi:hypothetical protein
MTPRPETPSPALIMVIAMDGQTEMVGRRIEAE